MILALLLYLSALVALLQGVPAFLDANNIMQQIFGAVHILGGLMLFGVAFAIQRIEQFGKELTSFIKSKKEENKAGGTGCSQNNSS